MREQKPPIQIIAVPIDLGASRRGTDAGPSAMRVAGLHQALETLGYSVLGEIDIPVPGAESCEAHDPSAHDDHSAESSQ